MDFLRKIRRAAWNYICNTDKVLILLCLLASAYGVALVYSAAYSSGSGREGYLMQLVMSIAGLVAALIISRFDYESICRLWPFFAGIALLLVFLTFTPLGLNVPGTDDTAWLGIKIGSREITFQPAELLKIAFIITFSKHLSAVRDHINQPLTLLALCAHGLFPVGLIFLQGDHGTGLVFFFMFLAMMFAAGVKPLYFLFAGIVGCASVPILWNFLLDDQKKNRILALLFVDEYMQDTGWQQYTGLMSMGSGQLWGVGYLQGGGHGLYARNNDFIFTVAGEEFGFIGALALIALLLLIVLRMLQNSVKARDRLGMFICIGMMSLIGFQSLINIGMTLRFLPVIGITLPFFSAGGSSVFTLYLGVGLTLSVYYSSRTRTRNTIFTKKL